VQILEVLSGHFLPSLNILFYSNVEELAASHDVWDGTVHRCSEFHMEKFRSGEFEALAPAASYRNVIVHGLVEDLGLTEEQAHDYVSSAVLSKDGAGS